jgi:arylsulfatase A-like enzyme
MNRFSAQLIDIVPTILAAAGVDGPESLRGRDLLSGSFSALTLFSEMPGYYAAISDGLKLVYDSAENRFMLYDLVEDPDETVDLSEEDRYRDPGGALARELARLQSSDRLGAGVRRSAQDLTEEEKEKFKALGYTQ